MLHKILILLFLVSYTHGQGSAAKFPTLQPVLDKFFSLFDADCANWASVFAENAAFIHPIEGTIAGRSALQSFCEKAQKFTTGKQTFRQDGSPMVTLTSSNYRVLVPYVYSNNVDFTNSGLEVFDLSLDGTVIRQVTELFSRRAQPPFYGPPPANSTSVLDRFFSLFDIDCDIWVQLFSENATFIHPLEGTRAGRTQLKSFCKTVQNLTARKVEFRQDGSAITTMTTTHRRAYVPYVYSNDKGFVNTGYEVFDLTLDGAVINEVTEFFTRSSLPPSYGESAPIILLPPPNPLPSSTIIAIVVAAVIILILLVVIVVLCVKRGGDSDTYYGYKN